MAAGGDSVTKVKEKLSIVEVISPYVKLTKAGKYYRGLTPFGKEKTPSFYVSPDRGTYYCFSTGQGGDHFTFIEKMEGVDFKGALKILAEKAGIELEEYRGSGAGKAAKDRLDKLREATALAESFYAAALTEDSPAYAYARSRGLAAETIRGWNLGFAPEAWRALLEHLSAAGYTPADLAAAGLVKEADEKRGTFYDRFRNRLMFPICDAAGRTVAFTGRALSSDDQAKYLNSPETDLYKKSEVLFGMDRAKDAIRQRGFALLVEGQFDLVLLHQSGFTNTIALSGTALSAQHLALIKRYADNLMLCLDADRAGLAASAKNARAALLAGMRVKAVRLPEGKDPADIVSEDPQAFAQLVKDSKSVIEFFLAVLAAQETDDFKLMRRVEEIVLPLVVAVKSPIERERFVQLVARALAVSPETVKAALPKPDAPAMQQAAGEPRTTGTGAPSAAAPSAPATPLETRRLQVLAIVHNYPETALAKRVESEYIRISDGPIPDDVVPDERALFEAGLTYGETPDEHACDDLLRVFEQTILTERLKAAAIDLRKAEAADDQEKIQQAANAHREISRRLASFT